MDPTLENKIDFDEAMVTVNDVLRKVRKNAIDRQKKQPLHYFAIATADLVNRLTGYPPNCAETIREYARLIDQVADGVEKYEAAAPLGERCEQGILVVHQLILPVMVSISCVAGGLELRRGKAMQLEDANGQ